jgi:hypothetical protein
MRGYYIPLTAGVALCISAFLPWVHVSGVAMRGVPDIPGLWIAGLGVFAAVLATLSLITRKNSRHPLLLVGLVALAILFLSWRILPRSAGERARTVSQAYAIVESRPMEEPPVAVAGSGIYLGLVASAIIVGFGLTIVVRRVHTPYTVVSPDDDVD